MNSSTEWVRQRPLAKRHSLCGHTVLVQEKHKMSSVTTALWLFCRFYPCLDWQSLFWTLVFIPCLQNTEIKEQLKCKCAVCCTVMSTLCGSCLAKIASLPSSRCNILSVGYSPSQAGISNLCKVILIVLTWAQFCIFLVAEKSVQTLYAWNIISINEQWVTFFQKHWYDQVCSCLFVRFPGQRKGGVHKSAGDLSLN